ncbi:hypothetical protein [uncultured Pseudacidovorax sp.]|uniref:hypothetical protein n=1 Tax=uncultured Pseudacidovorax sp. TaxID=679313 RepID=UPI0025E41879|nr:hypothetical protein [uncultured Pseudacidovorax sp.]
MNNTESTAERHAAPTSAELSASDLRRSLAILASHLAVLDGLLSIAMHNTGETADRAVAGAAQLCEYMTGLADATSGGQIRGHVEHWIYGMDYPALGKIYPCLSDVEAS